MKTIINERQQYWTDFLHQRYLSDFKSLDEVERAHVDEVINAIACGCCWKNARVFQHKAVDAAFFQKLARLCPFNVICVAVEALAKADERGDVIYNRMWYILGTLVRIEPQAPNPHRQTKVMKDGYKQRQYTKEELRAIATDISTFSEADL